VARQDIMYAFSFSPLPVKQVDNNITRIVALPDSQVMSIYVSGYVEQSFITEENCAYKKFTVFKSRKKERKNG
jgi:hypothetical protein